MRRVLYFSLSYPAGELVGVAGFEPAISRARGVRFNRLSYTPLSSFRGAGCGARSRTETDLINNQALCQLSYATEILLMVEERFELSTSCL
jgi:hypothetical protein